MVLACPALPLRRGAERGRCPVLPMQDFDRSGGYA